MTSGELFGYVGPGPGAEFRPQFNILLIGGGLLLLAILLWPIMVLCRFLLARRTRQREPADDPVTPSQESPS
jgi:hypothetical protein